MVLGKKEIQPRLTHCITLPAKNKAALAALLQNIEVDYFCETLEMLFITMIILFSVYWLRQCAWVYLAVTWSPNLEDIPKPSHDRVFREKCNSVYVMEGA